MKNISKIKNIPKNITFPGLSYSPRNFNDKSIVFPCSFPQDHSFLGQCQLILFLFAPKNVWLIWPVLHASDEKWLGHLII